MVFLLLSILSSFVQSSMGFGNAMVLMAFLPFFITFSKALAYNQISCLLLTVLVVAGRWRKIRWKVMWPLIPPMVVSTIFFTFVSLSVDQSVLKIILGLFFIGLALFFLLSSSIKIRPTVGKGFIIGIITGVSNGLTGIGGPPVALYLRPSLSDNEEYLSTIQAFFLLQGIVGLFLRIGGGVLERGDLFPVAMIAAGTSLGAIGGSYAANKVDPRKMQKIVYGFVAMYGLYTVISVIAGL